MLPFTLRVAGLAGAALMTAFMCRAGGPTVSSTAATYRTLACGQTLTGVTKRVPDPSDIYGRAVNDTLVLDVTAAGYATLRVTGTTGHGLYLYNAAGVLVDTGGFPILANKRLAVGRYRLVVGDPYPAYNGIGVRTTAYGVLRTCAATPEPTYQTIASATPITANQRVYANLAGQTDKLYRYAYDPSAPPHTFNNNSQGYFPGADRAYSFTLPAPRLVRVRQAPGSERVSSTNYRNSHHFKVLKTASSGSLLTGTPEWNSTEAAGLLPAGAYYLNVEQGSSSVYKAYDFSLKESCVPAGNAHLQLFYTSLGSYTTHNYEQAGALPGYQYYASYLTATPGILSSGYIVSQSDSGNYVSLYQRVLLDLNDDGAFDAATETVFNSTQAQSQMPYSFLLSQYDPAIRALWGTTIGMRVQGSRAPISGDACNALPQGYTADMTLTITKPANPPAAGDFGFSALRQAKAMAGPERFNKVRVARDGSSYAAGAFGGTAAFSGGGVTQTYGSAGMQDGMLCHYDKGSKLLWTARFGGAGDDEAMGVAVDNFGYVYVAGYFTRTMTIMPGSGAGQALTSAGGTEGFLAKLNSAGALQWARRVGGVGMDYLNGVDVTGDTTASLAVAGSFTGAITFVDGGGMVTNLTSRGNSDAFLAQYTRNGTFTSVMQAGGPGNDYGNAVAMQRYGCFLIGSFEGIMQIGRSGFISEADTSAGGSDGFVSYVLFGGFPFYAARFGGAGNETLRDGAAVPGSDDVIAVGGFSSAFAPSRYSQQVLTPRGFYDAFAVRVQSHSNFLPRYYINWAQALGSAGQDQACGVRMDHAGNALVSGYFSNTAAFGTRYSLASAGGTDAFVAKLDGLSGTVLYAGRAGGMGDDAALAVDTADNWGAVACGRYTVAATFAPLPAVTSAGLTDAWLARYSILTNSISREGEQEEPAGKAPSALGASSLYPNPTTGRITFQNLPVELWGTQAKVLDLSGRTVAGFVLEPEADLGSLPAGLYYIAIGTARTKVVISK